MFERQQGANDIALGWVDALFPSDGQKTALVSALQAFATALKLVATPVLSWHTLSGIMSTAHEG